MDCLIGKIGENGEALETPWDKGLSNHRNRTYHRLIALSVKKELEVNAMFSLVESSFYVPAGLFFIISCDRLNQLSNSLE